MLVNTQKGEKALHALDLIIHLMDIDYEDSVTKYNWCMHRNPYGMPEEDRRTFYQDVVSMPFDQMAAKDLEVFRQARKKKKLEQKQVKYE